MKRLLIHAKNAITAETRHGNRNGLQQTGTHSEALLVSAARPDMSISWTEVVSVQTYGTCNIHSATPSHSNHVRYCFSRKDRKQHLSCSHPPDSQTDQLEAKPSHGFAKKPPIVGPAIVPTPHPAVM